MGRRYCDPIRVWLGPDQGGLIGQVPVRFRWRWCTYVVTEVLDRWIEAGQWWASAGAALRSGNCEDGQAGDRRVWRVEARAPGRTGVFDLCEHTPAAGRRDQPWLLVAALD